MKTIRQIADEIGVSKQSVYKRVKGSLHTVVAPYMHTTNGIVYISEQGESFIIKAFSERGIYKGAYDGAHTEHIQEYTEYTENSAGSGSEISFLREQNKALVGQLAEKDKQLENERTHSREQADKLSDLAAQLAELTRNNQVLLGAEQTRTNPALLMGNDELKQVGFKERIKILLTGKSY